MSSLLDVGEAALAVAGFVGFVAACHVALPAYRTTAYACGWDGAPLAYRLNAPLVLGVVALAWSALLTAGGADGLASFAARRLWACWLGANLAGLLASAFLFVRGGAAPERSFRCLTVDQKALCEKAARGEDAQALVAPAPPRGAAAHFFFGRQFNPRLRGGLDLKMLCYTVGAAGLLWNVREAAAPLRRAHTPTRPHTHTHTHTHTHRAGAETTRPFAPGRAHAYGRLSPPLGWTRCSRRPRCASRCMAPSRPPSARTLRCCTSSWSSTSASR